MEEWKDVYQFEDLYEVSNIGNIRHKGKTEYKKISFDPNGYPYSSFSKNGKGKRLQIHRLVALAFIPNTDNKQFVDHIDQDKSNNRVSNLRWASRSENYMNRTKYKCNKSGYKGVFFSKSKNKYRAEIRLNKKSIFIGYYESKEEAAIAYNEKARELFGEYASLNVITYQ